MIFVTPHPAEKLQYFFGVFLQFQIGVDSKLAAGLPGQRSEEGAAAYYIGGGSGVSTAGADWML